MKITSIGNGVEVSDIDLHDDEACRELGRIVAQECVVLLRQAVPEPRLHAIQMLWGQPCIPIVNRYVLERRLTGRHWRKAYLAMANVVSALENANDYPGMCRVTIERNTRDKGTGMFPQGKLEWHSDQQSYHDNQRVIGLMSLWGSRGSQTAFFCTAPAYEALNHEDRSLVDELVCVWGWDSGTMSPNVDDDQLEIVRYNMNPMDGMETRLVDRTATGRVGVRFPSHCFSHFKGMGVEESTRCKAELWEKLYRPEYAYTHDWRDGEIVFMDQNITLHARPTYVAQGDTRTMCRMISYFDNLFASHGPADHVLFDGARLSHDEFAALVDRRRQEEFSAKSAAA